jgi:glycosyltransferase involved in cell wall biosynthesis
METKVTLGICVKNCEATVKEAIDSIVNQDYPHELMEIIVVDNGSKDRTLSAINKSISKTDLRVKTFRARGKGMGEIRQMVVDNAQGRYILWVDGDIILTKDYLQKQVKFMERNPCVGVTMGKIEGCEKGTLVSTLESIARSSDYRLDFRKTTPPRLATGGSVFRVKTLKKVGGFDRNIIGAGEDTEVMIRIEKAGYSLFLSQKKFYHKFKEKWRDVINQQLWYGYGVHYLRHKCKGQVTLWVRTPLTAFVDGLIRSLKAYRVMHQKRVFLLPLYNFSKTIAWWFGFFKSHNEGYGHEPETPEELDI